ncbi:hypothetical protein OH492_12210 [Vibrio chagasii]|nr:hypothetical protein [Vibrio chagasii]
MPVCSWVCYRSLNATNVISETSDGLLLPFNFCRGVLLLLTPMLVSFSAAKVFKVNEYIALAVSSAMLAPKLVDKAVMLKMLARHLN